MKTKIALVFSNIVLLSLLLVSWNGKENSTTNSNIVQDCDATNLNFITKEDAIELASNYDKSVNKINTSIRTTIPEWKEDSRCAWYSYEELSKYLCFINKIHKNGKNPNAKLGIRIYYGRYPNDLSRSQESQTLKTQDDRYKNKHCLFFVPTLDATYTNGKGEQETIHQDFFINQNQNNQKGMIFFSANFALNSDKNHGSLEPPSDTQRSGAYFLNN